MADGSANVLVANLTKLDTGALSQYNQKTLLKYYLGFLTKLKSGFEEWQNNNPRNVEPNVAAPFLRDNRGQFPYYNLYFAPRAFEPPQGPTALYLIDAAHVLDDLYDWFLTSLSAAADQEVFTKYNASSSFSRKLILGNDVTRFDDTSLINSRDWREQFTAKLGTEIALTTELLERTTEEVTASSIEPVVQTLTNADEADILKYWLNPIPSSQTFRSWLQLFFELPVGAVILAGNLNTRVEELRQLSNVYTTRIGLIIQNGRYQSQLSVAPQEVKDIADRLRRHPEYFDPEVKIPEKTDKDQEVLRAELLELDELVKALLVDVPVEKKEPSIVDLAYEKAKADKAAEGEGGSESTPPESPDITAAKVSPPPTPTSATNPAASQTPTAELLNFSSQAFAIQSGFISVQVMGDFCGLYGLPFDQVPRETILEVQEAVRVRLLQQLRENPDAANLSRFQLGQIIFHQILRDDVTLIHRVRQSFINVAQDKSLTLANQDPLNLDQNADSTQRTTLYDQAKLAAAPPTDSQEAEAARAALAQAAATGAYSLSIVQSDAQLEKALTELHIDDKAKQLFIKNSVASYLYSFGIGPEELLTNINDRDLQQLFGVTFSPDHPEQIELFKQVLTGYWLYQKTYLENVTGHQFIPNRNLLRALQNHQLDNEQMAEITSVGTHNIELFLTDSAAFRDPRLRLIATQVTHAELNDPAKQTKLLTQLESLYPDLNDAERAENAGRSFEAIRELQDRQRAYLANQMAAQINQQRLEQLIVVAQQQAYLSDVQQEALNNAVLSYQMGQIQKASLIQEITNRLAVQQMMALFDESEVPGGAFGAAPRQGLLSQLARRSRSQFGPPSTIGGLKRAKELVDAGDVAALVKGGTQQVLAVVAGQLARRLFGDEVGNQIQNIIDKAALAAFIAQLIGWMGSAIGGLISIIGLPALALGAVVGGSVFADLASRLFTSATGTTPTALNPFSAQSAQAASANAAAHTVAAPAAAHGLTANSLFTSGANLGMAAVGTAAAVTAVIAIASVASTNAALIKPFGTEINAGLEQPLGLVKSANPSTKVGPNQTVVYSLKLTGNAGAFSDITVTDAIKSGDESKFQPNSLKLISNDGADCPPQNNNGLICTIASLGHGDEINITYSLQTSDSVTSDGKTAITNEVTATGTEVDSASPPFTSTTSLTLNSNGQIIADISQAITGALVKGWWGFYNYAPDHPDLFNTDLWNTDTGTLNPQAFSAGSQTFPCVDSDIHYPCTDSHDSHEMFWCTWNVIYSFFQAGRPIADPTDPGGMTNVGVMRQYFEQQATNGSGTYIPNPTADQIQVGDVAFFEKKTSDSDDTSAHTSIVIDITPISMTTSDSNNYAPKVTYTVSNNQVEPMSDGTTQIILNGIARLN